jgi:hypothetical protein
MTMTVTFADARSLVQKQLNREWGKTPGTPTTLSRGYQDATHWQVVAGAREYLIDGKPGFELMDAPVWLVSKATGEITKLTAIDSFDRLGKMTRV